MLMKRMCHITVVVDQSANAAEKAKPKKASSEKAGK